MTDDPLQPAIASQPSIHLAVPLSQPPRRRTAGQAGFDLDRSGTDVGTAIGMTSLKSLAQQVLLRDNLRDKGWDTAPEACPVTEQSAGTAGVTKSGGYATTAGPEGDSQRAAEIARIVGAP